MATDDLWAEALREVESEARQPGLWARCFAQANGDESKAKAAYISEQVEQQTTALIKTGFCPNCDHECQIGAPKCEKCGGLFGDSGWILRTSPRTAPIRPMLHTFEGSQPASSSFEESRSAPYVVKSAKSRGVYIILGIFFGLLGIHNFYAGRLGVGLAQLLITCILGWFVIGLVITAFWAIFELFTVTHDGAGDAFA